MNLGGYQSRTLNEQKKPSRMSPSLFDRITFTKKPCIAAMALTCCLVLVELNCRLGSRIIADVTCNQSRLELRTPEKDALESVSKNGINDMSSVSGESGLMTTVERMKIGEQRSRNRVFQVRKISKNFTHDLTAAWAGLVGLSPQDFQCNNLKRLGSFLDGGWTVCFDSVYNLAGRPPGDCLVYSFGLSTNWAWDYDVMATTACEVHGFDHTISAGKEQLDGEPDPGLHAEDKIKTSYLRNTIRGFRKMPHGSTYQYHSLGISSKDVPEKKTFTLGTFMETLGHKDRYIDYLKVDVEGAEWPSVLDSEVALEILMTRVKQLGLEFHIDRGVKTNSAKAAAQQRMVARLMLAGFVTTASNPNIWYCHLRETVFLNSRFVLDPTPKDLASA